jgi:hypothetical protein
MTQITSPAVTADPLKGIVGSPGVARWVGSVQAYIDEDVLDEVRSGGRLQIAQTIVDLPVNLPVWPNLEDTVRVVRTGIVTPYIQGWPLVAPQSEDLIVRKVDGGLVMLGKLRLYVTRGTATPL